MTRMTNVATRTFTNITGRNSVQHLEIPITTRKTAPITKTPYTSAKMTDLWKQGTMTKKIRRSHLLGSPSWRGMA